jgi:hypothetical protein
MGFEGKWDCTMKTQMGDQQMTLTFGVDGDKLTGTVSGGMIGSIEITDGKVEGDTATYNVAITQPMAMTLACTANVDGDKLTGSVQMGSFGSATFEGARA